MVKLIDKFDELLVGSPYTLSMTLPGTDNFIGSYDLETLSKYLDFVNIYSLDYSTYSTTAQHSSPFIKQLQALERYNYRGFPRENIFMSVPLYARTFKFANSSDTQIGSPTNADGTPGPITDEAGLLSYHELCSLIKSKPNEFRIVHDDDDVTVHAIRLHDGEAEFISFEDKKTLATKAYNITSQGYAGISVHYLSYDDFDSTCGEKYPLLHAVHDNYHYVKHIEEHVPTKAPQAVDETSEDIVCQKVGTFASIKFCNKYFHCISLPNGTFEKVTQYCEEKGTAFDNDRQKCVPGKEVKGCA